MVIPIIHMHRFEWILRNSEDYILDVGCNDTSLWSYNMWYPPYPNKQYIKDIIFFDCDLWIPIWLKCPKFIRGDALHLPFKNNVFDTIILGDILEHVNNPMIVLKECIRVTKHKIVITIPCENEWNVSSKISYSNKNIVDTYCGIDDQVENQEIKSTLEHSSIMAKCISAISEKVYKHIWHQQIFDDDKIIKLFSSLYNIEYNIFKLKYGIKNEELVTYGVVIWKND